MRIDMRPHFFVADSFNHNLDVESASSRGSAPSDRQLLRLCNSVTLASMLRSHALPTSTDED
jgi:hypothetical protein